jgi:hypothetical protein
VRIENRLLGVEKSYFRMEYLLRGEGLRSNDLLRTGTGLDTSRKHWYYM